MDIVELPPTDRGELQPARMILEYSNHEINEYIISRYADQNWPASLVNRFMDCLWNLDGAAVHRQGLDLFIRFATEAPKAIRKDDERSSWMSPDVTNGPWEMLISHLVRGLGQFRFNAEAKWYLDAFDRSLARNYKSNDQQLKVLAALGCYWSMALMAGHEEYDAYLMKFLSEALSQQAVTEAVAKATKHRDWTAHLHWDDAILFCLARPCLAVETTKGVDQIEVNLQMLFNRCCDLMGVEFAEQSILGDGDIRRVVVRLPVKAFLEQVEQILEASERSSVHLFLLDRQLRLRIAPAGRYELALNPS
jgi:hypothetical protein